MRSRFWRLVSGVVVAAALVIGVAGCGDDDDSGTQTSTTQTQADAALCASVDSLKTAVGQLQDLEPGNVSRAELTSIAASVSASWGNFATALSSARDVDSTAIRAAWEDTQDAILAIPGSGQSPQEAVESVQATLPPLQDALEGLAPNCDGSTTTESSTETTESTEAGTETTESTETTPVTTQATTQ